MDLERGNPFGWEELIRRVGIRLGLLLILSAFTLIPAYHKYRRLTDALHPSGSSTSAAGTVEAVMNNHPDLFTDVHTDGSETSAQLSNPQAALAYLSSATIPVRFHSVNITAFEDGYRIKITQGDSN